MGRTARVEGAVRTAQLEPSLRLPAGADSMDEGLWHRGSDRWGTVRIYRFSEPLDVAPRQWRQARTFEGSSGPAFALDRFGVQGLLEVSAYVDTAGRVVAVMPTGYESLTDVEMSENPPGAVEPGD